MPGEFSTASVAFDDIQHGSWSCRWGQWIILVRERPPGWAVVVWELPPGAPMTTRRQIGASFVEGTAQDAVRLACGVLYAVGVSLLVSGVAQPLEKFLSFFPAPQEVL